MGSSHKSIYHGRRRWGRGQYFMGTHPLYLLGITGYRMMERPWILGGLNILFGYTQAWLAGEKQYDDPEFRRHLHRWQFQHLRERFLRRPPASSPPAPTPARNATKPTHGEPC